MSLEGYASATSVPQGGTIGFQINSSPPSSFQITVVKVGLSETKLFSDSGSANSYSTPADAYATGCGWPVAYTLQIPTTWSSGLYRADFTAGTDTMSIHFAVRASNPGSTSKILFQLATTTYEAYSTSQGNSLYPSPGSPGSANRSRMVSFDRPQDPSSYGYELPFLQWMEGNGFTCEFCTGIDLHTDDASINSYYLMLSVGHDEYWSKEMRDNVEAFVKNGGNVAFFSGNVCWWQVRFENSNRTMVCYKSAGEDPLTGVDDSRVTANWYDAPVNRPENTMTGVSFRNGAGNWVSPPAPQPGYVVQFAEHWVFDGIGLNMGDTFGNGIVGYETDAAQYLLQNGLPQVTGQDGTPANFQVLATADLSSWSTKGQSGMATLGIFQNTGTVFTAATVGWSALLQDPIVSQITKNVVQRLASLYPPDLWEQIGQANSVKAMAGLRWWADAVPAGSGVKLFAATSDDQLWWRDPLGINVAWQAIGTANSVVTMTALDGKLFAATSDNQLWWRDAVGQDIPWQAIGQATNVVAMAALDGKLFAATSDNQLWWRDAVGQDIPWQAIGQATNVVAMTSLCWQALCRDQRWQSLVAVSRWL